MSEFLEWTRCRFVRMLQRLLPASAFVIVFWPIAALGATRDVLLRRGLFRDFAHLPEPLRPRRNSLRAIYTLWRSRINMRLSLLVCIFADRLDSPDWQSRCEWNGIDRIDLLRDERRPIILAGFHVGPIKCLPHFMRARHWHAGTLANMASLPAFQQWVYALSDDAYGLHDVPRRINTAQLRDVVDFLQPQRILYIAVDGLYGKRIGVHHAGMQFQMATGFLRLAARTGARVVPCLIETVSPMRFVVHFGEPIDQQLADDEARHGEAGEQLIAQLLPLLRRCSHQYCAGHLRAYHREHQSQEPLWHMVRSPT